MGFTTGFTGGLTLTLSIAYLTVLAHQRNRQRQSNILRANAHVLNTLSMTPDSHAVVLPPSRAERMAQQRADFVETAKDRWNAEVQGAVLWAYDTDWSEVREQMEEGASRVWGRAFGKGPGEQAGEVAGRVKEEAVGRSREVVDVTRAKAGEARGSVSAAARGALEETKARGTRVAGVMEEKAGEAKTAAAGAIQKGIEKGKEVVGKAKAAVGLAEEKVESTISAKMRPLSDVEKALQQRYEKSDAMRKSVSEVLGERYKPIDRRDNTVLRGI